MNDDATEPPVRGAWSIFGRAWAGLYLGVLLAVFGTLLDPAGPWLFYGLVVGLLGTVLYGLFGVFLWATFPYKQ